MGAITNRDAGAERRDEGFVGQRKTRIASGQTKPGVRGGSPRSGASGQVHGPSATPAASGPGCEWIAEEAERRAQIDNHEIAARSRPLRTHEETQRTTHGNLSSQDPTRTGIGRDRRSGPKK
jgi:hypothetical protein